MLALRELPAIRNMLGLVPAHPESAQRPTAGQHVERGDDLAEMSDVSIGDACDHRAQPNVPRRCGQVTERRPTLEHVVPRRSHLGNLAEVVHHPETLEADPFSAEGDRAQTWTDLGRAARPRE